MDQAGANPARKGWTFIEKVRVVLESSWYPAGPERDAFLRREGIDVETLEAFRREAAARFAAAKDRRCESSGLDPFESKQRFPNARRS